MAPPGELSDAVKKECTGDDCDETETEKDDVSEEEMIPVDDWLALNEKEKTDESEDKSGESEKTEKQEDKTEKNESETDENESEEDKLDEDDAKLQESLKSYRRKNHHLFNG